MVHSLCAHFSFDGEFDELDDTTEPVIATEEFVFPGPDLGRFDVIQAIYQSYEEGDEFEKYQSIGTFSFGDGANLTNSTGSFNTKCMGGRLLWWNEPALKPLTIGQTF